MSHTPGPWTLCKGRNALYTDDTVGHSDYRRSAQLCLYVCGPAHDSDFVADLITDVGGAGLENARLIAAAPDLLEACKLAKGLLMEIAKATGRYPSVGNVAAIEAAIDAAVGNDD